MFKFEKEKQDVIYADLGDNPYMCDSLEYKSLRATITEMVNAKDWSKIQQLAQGDFDSSDYEQIYGPISEADLQKVSQAEIEQAFGSDLYIDAYTDNEEVFAKHLIYEQRKAAILADRNGDILKPEVIKPEIVKPVKPLDPAPDTEKKPSNDGNDSSEI